jgi:UDP-N-acetylenolpyruvoylglucosamine reductase
MDVKVKQLIALFGEHRVKLNEPLGFYTISQFAGKAEVFFIATTTQELIDVITASLKLLIPYQILGAGTKVNFTDPIVPGLVIKNRSSGIKISGVKGKVGNAGIGVEEALVEVDSGVSLGRINQFLLSQKLPALNFVSSTQATLGGSLLIESPIHQFIQSIRILEKNEAEEIEVTDLKKDQIILSAVFKIHS